MRRSVVLVSVAVCCLGLVGCGKSPAPDPTLPPTPPIHRMAAATLPRQIDGYTALGGAPVTGQTTTTYARDSQPLDLAVVTYDASGASGTTTLTKQQWYGASRCGTLWTSDSNSTPAPTQVACVTPLVDGVMTVVSGGVQTVEDMATLANAIYDTLEQ